ncbi:MAG: hypothetical protein Q8K37_06210, partial [Alphaproteobacteria bacterium]|nr:hypothetical protein [Alphaproteobacteria bacterium]
MKKIILLIASVIISTTCSYARVPIDQCFDLYQNTKEEYKHISPAWAEIALESNLIRNIRLFGHFNSTESTSYNAHPAFNVRQDTLKLNAPQDAISALFQYLFTTIDGQILTANQRDNDPIGYIGRAKRLDLINEILCASLSFKSHTTTEADFKKSIAISLDKIRPKNDKKGSRKKKFNAIRDQFIHILTNAIIEDRDNLHQSKYPEHAVSLSLFSFALTIAD